MRNSIRTAVTELILLVLSGAAFAVWSAEQTTPPRITISELLEQKQRWNGKRVEVVGFHRTQPEMSAAYETEEEADRPHRNASKGLWIVYSGSLPSVKLVKAGLVRIVGTFEFYPGRGCGHMNRWPAELRKLEQMEVMQPPNPKTALPPASSEATNRLHGGKK